MTNIAIENGPVEIVDFPMKNGGSFHSYVSLPGRVVPSPKTFRPHRPAGESQRPYSEWVPRQWSRLPPAAQTSHPWDIFWDLPNCQNSDF